jgi:hypothetical protein
MENINSKHMGLSCGLTGLIVYLGCILIMNLLGKNGTIYFFNNLLHGLDTTTIVTMKISLLNTVIGGFQTFFLFWLIGYSISFFYNKLQN